MKELRNISGVATQGSVSMGTWVTEYTLNYSSDGLQWQTYSNETGIAMVRILKSIFRTCRDTFCVLT